MPDEKNYKPGDRIKLKDGRTGKIITAPTVSRATGQTCYGVRFDDGSAKIACVGRDI